MFKRILFTFLTLLVLYTVIVIGYRVFQPDNADVYIYENDIEGALEFESLKDYTLSSSSSSIHYYLFFEQGDNDSIYLITTVLKDVETSINMDLSKIIEYVDIGSGEDTSVINTLSSLWKVDSYPGFAAVHVQDETIVVDNTLTGSQEAPISALQVKQWLSLNNIYQDEEELVESTAD